MIDKIIKKIECSGCNACYNVCPTNAVIMKNDFEGFWYPVVDYDLCINCDKCMLVCPALSGCKKEEKLETPLVYATYSKDSEVRINSTSGGMFSEISKYILNNNGVIFGARYDENNIVEHYSIEKIKDLKEIRQSKYVQSDIKDILRQVKKELNRERIVLFAGTPCHNAGLKNYLEKDYKNLYLVDFLCRGVISPKVYKKYLESLQKKYESNVESIIFKNKTYGWHRFSTLVKFKNGKRYLKDRNSDSYMRGYLEGNLYLRPSCHQCKFKTLPRNSDITLGDFWGIEKIKNHLDQDKGTSIFMINSQKGEYIFNKIQKNIIFEKCKVEDIYLGNTALTVSPPMGKKRKEFFKRFENENFENLVDELLKKSVFEENKFLIIKLLKKIKLYDVLEFFKNKISKN